MAGNYSKEEYLGINNEPVLCADGFACVSMDYDEWGNNTGIAFYGTNDELVMSSYGYAKATVVYDEEGNEIELELLDEKGDPIY